MGKSRVYGSNAKIYVTGPAGSITLTNGQVAGSFFIGEVDSFSAKSDDVLKKSRPLGETTHASQDIFKGYSLSFSGGKIDWKLAALIFGQDQQIKAGGRSPLFRVVQTIKHYDGNNEVWVYEDVSLFGYNLDAGGQTEELSEKFSGKAKRRVPLAGTKSADGMRSDTSITMDSLMQKLNEAAFGNFQLVSVSNPAPGFETAPVG